MISWVDDDHSSTLERDVGAGGDQSWRTSSAKWLKLCPLSQKSSTRTVEDVQASPSYTPTFRWTFPQVPIQMIHLNNAGAWSEVTKTFMKLKWWKLSKVTYLAMIRWVDDDHSSTLERDVGADGDQSWRTSSAKWLKLCPLSQKSPTRTVKDVQASPSYHTLFRWTVPQVESWWSNFTRPHVSSESWIGRPASISLAIMMWEVGGA